MHDGNGGKSRGPIPPVLSSIPVIHKPSAGAVSFVVKLSVIHLREIQQLRILMSRPQASRCSVFSFGFIVLPDTTSSTALCLTPTSIASLLIVMPFFAISSFSLPLVASAYVMPVTSLFRCLQNRV